MPDPVLSPTNLGLGWERVTATADDSGPFHPLFLASEYSGNADRIFHWTPAYNSMLWNIEGLAQQGGLQGNYHRLPQTSPAQAAHLVVDSGAGGDGGASAPDPVGQQMQSCVIPPHFKLYFSSANLEEGDVISALIYRPSRVEEEEDELW